MKREHILILLALAVVAFLVYTRCNCKCGNKDGFKGRLGVAPGGVCTPETEDCWFGYECAKSCGPEGCKNICQKKNPRDCKIDGTC